MASLSEALQIARSHHRQGRRDLAEQAYQEILRLDPYNADAMHLLGVLCYELKRFDDALQWLEQALAFDQQNARLHESIGLVFNGQNKKQEAVQAFHAALQCDPNYGNARLNLGNALRAVGNLDDAIVQYREAIQRNPQYTQAYNNLGSALRAKGDPESAEQCYRTAIQIDPNHAAAYMNLGNILQDLMRYEQAIEAYQKTIDLNPKQVQAHCSLGNTLQKNGQFQQAIESYNNALELRPNDASIFNDLAMAYQDLKQHDKALVWFRKAIDVSPNVAEVHNNMGNSLRECGLVEEGLASFERALEIRPNYATAHYNIGNFHRDQGNLQQAMEKYETAISLKANYAEAHFQRAFLCLLQGDFERGWSEYEWRWQMRQTARKKKNFREPKWEGQSLTGKTILVYSEQGLGDTIQFVRYLELLKRDGATVLFDGQPKLARLLKATLGFDQYLREGERYPSFDYHVALMSLPGIFKMNADNVPRETPYVHVETDLVEKWKNRLSEFSGLKVGVNWQGSMTYLRDKVRSIPLRHFSPLAGVPDVTLLGIQKGEGANQIADCADSFAVFDLGAELDEGPDAFVDTAAVMKNLDLVITSDTSVAHLAGALGVPVWVALNYVPEWRFMLERSDSPWYPTMRLFRQKSNGDWEGVFEEIANALRSYEPVASKDEGGTDTDGGSSLEPAGIDAAIAEAANAVAERQVIETQAISNAQSTDQASGLTQPNVGTTPLDQQSSTNEVDRRKQVIEQRGTDYQRWSDSRNLETEWNSRAQMAARFIPAGATVLDLGCGAMALERFLPFGCSYIPCDLVARDARTLVADFNQGQIPEIGAATHITMLGVLEYIYDPSDFLASIRRYDRPVLMSYCTADTTTHLDRGSLGWVNHLSKSDIVALAEESGFHVQTVQAVDGNQSLFQLSLKSPQVHTPKNVVALSFFNVGNFGDRLGFHSLNEVLPTNAQVHHAYFDVQQGYVPVGVPDGEIDLLVVGLGNSVFGPVITDAMSELIARSQKSIGIFGTQYREMIDRSKFSNLVRALDIWYARYEEDVRLFGGGHDNVVHLGDWLINAFPMAQPTLDETFEIQRADVWEGQALDRIIQKIQRYKRVHSTRVHSLLCAMCSAEQVAYTEQEFQGNRSGKFRSQLVDILGHSFPEEKYFEVDRQAVVAYKSRVRAEMEKMRKQLNEWLG